MHPQHQCLKLRLRGIRAFSTHLEPGGALASASWCNLPEFQCLETEIAPPDFVRLLGRLVNYVRMVQFGLSVRRGESTAKK